MGPVFQSSLTWAKVADRLPNMWKIHHPESVRTDRAEERRSKAKCG
jgi:hypothetical protein